MVHCYRFFRINETDWFTCKIYKKREKFEVGGGGEQGTRLLNQSIFFDSSSAPKQIKARIES